MYTLILSPDADLWQISETPMPQRLQKLDIMEKIFIDIMKRETFECRVIRVQGKATLIFDCQGPDERICSAVEATLMEFGH